jgi:hypothetical protein
MDSDNDFGANSSENSEQSVAEKFFDDNDEYTCVADLLSGLERGELLVHARVPDGTNFAYGISPSAGVLLQSTEAWQAAVEEYGDGPELTFFSDGLSWAQSTLLGEVRGNKSADLEVLFVRKSESIVLCCENGKIQNHTGKLMPYEHCTIADHEDPLFKEIPAGVETGDWFTNKEQDVVAVVPSSSLCQILDSTNKSRRRNCP